MDFVLNALHENILQATIASEAYIAKMLKNTNEKARGHTDYAPLDAVWVFKTSNKRNSPRKLTPCYHGPFFISRKLQENVYKITKRIREYELRGSVAAQRLKPFYLKSCQPPEPTGTELAFILTTPEPDLSQPSTELKNSCIDNVDVRSRDTDIDLYHIPDGNVTGKDVTSDLYINVSDLPVNKGKSVRIDKQQPPITNVQVNEIDTTKIIEFTSSKTRPNRDKNDYNEVINKKKKLNKPSRDSLIGGHPKVSTMLSRGI